MNFAPHFKDTKITVLGLGLLGRGVGDVQYLAEAGVDLIVTDRKSEAELKESVEQLKEYENITWRLGEHKEEDFVDRDYILVGAGVPLDSPYVAAARAAGVELKQSAAWFAELAKIPVIGITGTRGKSTVTAMVHHVLSFITGEEILLGGNVRGLSNLQLLNQVQENSLCVMELDSWQLQGWGWSEMSPQISVFTNFMEDHQNYYPDMDTYFADKAQIFLHQDPGGVLVTTPEVFEQAKGLAGSLAGEVVLADASVIPEDCLLAMPGEHNRLNAALAYETLKAVSLTDEEIFEGLASFSGVEGRLQLVKTVDNVRIYNDNNATTPAATAAGLETLDLGNKNIILIAGGADKGLDVAPLAHSILEHCKQVVLTPGDGTNALLELIHNQDLPVTVVEDLKTAIEEARLGAQNGDIILFSPAFASFAQYANEYERNDEFTSLVEKL